MLEELIDEVGLLNLDELIISNMITLLKSIPVRLLQYTKLDNNLVIISNNDYTTTIEVTNTFFNFTSSGINDPNTYITNSVKIKRIILTDGYLYYGQFEHLYKNYVFNYKVKTIIDYSDKETHESIRNLWNFSEIDTRFGFFDDSILEYGDLLTSNINLSFDSLDEKIKNGIIIGEREKSIYLRDSFDGGQSLSTSKNINSKERIKDIKIIYKREQKFDNLEN